MQINNSEIEYQKVWDSSLPCFVYHILCNLCFQIDRCSRRVHNEHPYRNKLCSSIYQLIVVQTGYYPGHPIFFYKSFMVE